MLFTFVIFFLTSQYIIPISHLSFHSHRSYLSPVLSFVPIAFFYCFPCLAALCVGGKRIGTSDYRNPDSNSKESCNWKYGISF